MMTRAPRQLRRYSTPSFIRNAGLCIRDKPAMKASASKNLSLEGLRGLARKTHKKNSKAASVYCKFLLLNKLNLTKRTPLQ